MAVFTPLTQAALEQLAHRYGIPGTPAYSGIADGIENSSFLVYPDSGHEPRKPKWVLTIVEELDGHGVAYVARHLQRLSTEGIPVPSPLKDESGQTIQTISGKPALLFPFLEGRHVVDATRAQCHRLGEVLARAHQVPVSARRGNAHGWSWLQSSAGKARPQMAPVQREILDTELKAQAEWQDEFDALPEATIHADLFRDNVLFDGDRLTGLIDWYSACTGPMLYDIAVTLNDWCRNRSDQIDGGPRDTLLQGYASVRPLEPDESANLVLAQRRAALRFWLSRLEANEALPHKNGDTLCKSKDPREFERLLRWLQSAQ